MSYKAYYQDEGSCICFGCGNKTNNEPYFILDDFGPADPQLCPDCFEAFLDSMEDVWEEYLEGDDK